MYKSIHLYILCNTGSCSTLTDGPWGWHVGAISVWTTSEPALNQLLVRIFSFFLMLCFACLLRPPRRPLAFLNKFIFIIQMPFNTKAIQAWKMWRDKRDAVLRICQSSSHCCISLFNVPPYSYFTEMCISVAHVSSCFFMKRSCSATMPDRTQTGLFSLLCNWPTITTHAFFINRVI